MLAIASTAIGAFCPYLAQHTDVLLDGVDKNINPGHVTPWDESVEDGQVCTIENLTEDGPVITASETNSSFKSTSTFSSFLNL